jgi:hypothetical protein
LLQELKVSFTLSPDIAVNVDMTYAQPKIAVPNVALRLIQRQALCGEASSQPPKIGRPSQINISKPSIPEPLHYLRRT